MRSTVSSDVSGIRIASASGKAAHERIPGSELYDLGLEDEDVPLIPYPDWAPYEPVIAQVLTDFMRRN